MPATLNPASGRVLDTIETELTSVSINAVGFSSVVWTYSFTPTGFEGINFSFVPAGLVFTINYISDENLFPLEFIKYIDNERELQQVDSFADLPPVNESPYITLMREDDKDLIEWNLSVTASGTDINGNSATVTGNYEVVVKANYNTSKDLLTGAIDERG